jgi:hypothetical protein
MSEPRDPAIERLLRPDEVAAILRIPLRTIYRWRSRHEGPRGYRIGQFTRRSLDVNTRGCAFSSAWERASQVLRRSFTFRSRPGSVQTLV